MTRKFPLVVLAEDDPDLRELLAEGLVEGGFDVVEAEDGVELLEVLGAAAVGRTERPDLVVTDVRMPRLSGLDALAELQGAEPPLPVLVITAFGDEPTRALAAALGAAAVLDKPVDVEALVDRVRRLLGWGDRADGPPLGHERMAAEES